MTLVPKSILAHWTPPESRGCLLALDYVKQLTLDQPWVKRHSERVARLAAQIAQVMGLDEKHIREAEVAGALHDIGKVFVEEKILYKPKELTPDELGSIRSVPVYSASIAHLLGLSPKVQMAISQRHERPDGRGYPFGIEGERIGLLARIVAVADVFDSLTYEQPYRKKCSKLVAIGVIRSKSGFRYDPNSVDCLTTLVLRKPH